MNLSNTSAKLSIESPIGLKISLIPFIPFPAAKAAKTPSIELKSIEPNISPKPLIIGERPLNTLLIPVTNPLNASPILNPEKEPKKSLMPFPTLLNALSIASNALFMPFATFPNISDFVAASAILDTNLPIPPVTVKTTFPKPPNILPNGANDLTTPSTA